MESLKGKPTRSKPRSVINYDIQIPSEIYKNSSNIDLYIDVVYINRFSFLISIDSQVKHRSIIHITSQNEE